MKFSRALKTKFGEYVQILKSINGLKQAARVWFLLITNHLESMEFQTIPTDPSIMIRGTGSKLTIIGIYVDDLSITGGDNGEIMRRSIRLLLL